MSTDVIVGNEGAMFEDDVWEGGRGGRCEEEKRRDTNGETPGVVEPPLWCFSSAILLCRTLLRPTPIRSKGLRNERRQPVQSDTLRLMLASSGNCSLSSDLERPCCCKWSDVRDDWREDCRRGSCSTEPLIELDSQLVCDPREILSCQEFDLIRRCRFTEDVDNMSDSEICRLSDVTLCCCCWILSRDTDETERPRDDAERPSRWFSMKFELSRLYHFRPSCLL